MNVRRTLSLVLGTALCVMGASANAQNLDLDEVGALLALPVVTGGPQESAATYITITNAGAAVDLHINVISGDPEDSWKSQDFTCPLTTKETALFFFTPGPSGSRLSYECDTVENVDGRQGVDIYDSPLDTRNGIMVVALEDPVTGETINTNQIFGDAVVIDYSGGSAYSVNAIPFQGVLPGGGTGDRKYRFDNVEYTEWPSALATNFLAVGQGYEGFLILFTLDGTTGSAEPPPAAVAVKFYNDDEVQFSSSYNFDCFSIVDLKTIDDRFRAGDLGSRAGHLTLVPQPVTYPNLAHDSQFDGAQVPGVRTPPVHGWIFQTVAGESDDPRALYKVGGGAAWARTLAQSQMPVIASPGDVPVLNAP